MDSSKGELSKLSGKLSSFIDQHARGFPQEERFYACNGQLAHELELKVLPWQSEPLGKMTIYRFLHDEQMKLGGRHGHTLLIGGQLAEERAPSFILAGELRPLSCLGTVGTETASWPELCWGLLTQANSAASLESPSESMGLAMRRWQSRWAPTDWLQADDKAFFMLETPWEAAMQDDKENQGPGAHGHSSLIFDDLNDLARGAMMLSRQPPWSAQEARSALSMKGSMIGQRGSKKVQFFQEALKLAFDEEQGYQRWPQQGHNRTCLAWAPFPEAGEGCNLVALVHRGDGQEGKQRQLAIWR